MEIQAPLIDPMTIDFSKATLRANGINLDDLSDDEPMRPFKQLVITPRLRFVPSLLDLFIRWRNQRKRKT